MENLNIENGLTVVVNRNSTLYRMGIRPGYVLTEINEKSIGSTTDLRSFEKENIYQTNSIWCGCRVKIKLSLFLFACFASSFNKKLKGSNSMLLTPTTQQGK